MNPGDNAQPQSQQSIFVEPTTNCLYTMHPATGQPTWIVDYETSQPMMSRQLFIDPSTGGMCAASLTGAGYVWVINPATGMPFMQPPQPSPQQSSVPQTSTTTNQAQQQPAALQNSTIPSESNASFAAPANEQQTSATIAEAPASDSVAPDSDDTEDLAAPKAPAKVPIAAIIGPVLGVSAIGVSFIPPIDIAAPFVALLGFIVSIIGTVQACKRKKGLGIAITGVVFGIIAAVVIALTNSAVSTAVSNLLNPSPQAPAPAPSAAVSVEPPARVEPVDYTSLVVGQSFKLDSGLTVSVISVKSDLKGSKDKKVTGVTVKYTNTGTAQASYSAKDWKSQNVKGKAIAATENSAGSAKKDSLGSGKIDPGKTATGTVYFAGDITSISFYEDAKSPNPAATWIL